MTGFFWGALCFFVAVSAWCGEISGRNVIAWAKDIKSKPLFRTVVSNRKTTLQFSADNTAPTRGVQFGVRSSRGLSAGDYRLTFTLESNTAFKQRFNVILHKAPWTVVEGKTVSVRAGVPEKVEIPFTVTEEMAGSCFRLPGCSFFQPFKKGTVISIGNIELLGKPEEKKTSTPDTLPRRQAYDFRHPDAKQLILHGSARIENGELILDGNGWAELPRSSELFKLTPSGLTLTAVVAFDQPAATKTLQQSLFSKGLSSKTGEEWSFWRMNTGVMASIFP